MEDEDVIIRHTSKNKSNGENSAYSTIKIDCIIHENGVGKEFRKIYTIPSDQKDRILPLLELSLEEIIAHLHT